MKYLTHFLALLGLFSMLAYGDWRIPCHGTVVRERIDPVIEPGAISGHVHRVVGGSGINFTMDYLKTVSSGCSSCSVKTDKSNYWVPQLYYADPTRGDTRYSLVPDGGVNITYTQTRTWIGPGNHDWEPIQLFPKGLTMTAGDPSRRNFTGDSMSEAIWFHCPHEGIISHELPTNCTSLIGTVVFPSCWNGRDVTTDDFSHMSYPEGGFIKGKCPVTHPVRLLTLRYDFEFVTTKLAVAEPPFVFSNGDNTGFGFHGVFISGWDTAALQDAIDYCTDELQDNLAASCPFLHQYSPEEMADCKVPPRVDEDITGVMALPGCNPIMSQGCNNATSTNISDYQFTYENLTGVHWKWMGCSSWAHPFDCIRDGFDCTKKGIVSTSDPNMKSSWCASWCESKNLNSSYVYAAVRGQYCQCSPLDPIPRAAPEGRFLGNCDTPCPGDNHTCGGSNSTSIYRSCPPGSDCHNAEFLQWPAIGQLAATPKFQKRTLYPNNNDEQQHMKITTAATAAPSIDSSRPLMASHPPVSATRIEAPQDHSIFIGYKVCARSFDFSSSSDSSPTGVYGISCSVIEGYRAEGVAAAFIAWAVREYGLDPHDVYAEPEDAVDARIARRMVDLHRMRPHVMGFDFVLAVVMVSSVVLLGFGIFAKYDKVRASQRRRKLDLRDDFVVAERLLEMDPEVLEVLFAKYEAMKERQRRGMEERLSDGVTGEKGGSPFF